MNYEPTIEEEPATTIDTKDRDEIKKPRKYHVVLHNDNYTPVDFVVQLLTFLFGHSYVAATEIAMEVHNKGKGIAGTYPYDIAETKAAQVIENARQNEHPLLADVEEASDE